MLRCLNRMHETLPPARVRDRCCSTARTFTTGTSTSPRCGSTLGWSSSGRPPSRRCRSATTSRRGCSTLRGSPLPAAADEIVERALRRAALWDEVKDRLRDSAVGLSGGQQQRLCIARALAIEPQVLLLDEPTASLDPISTQKVEELVYELRRDMTVVIVTHNMQQAARVLGPHGVHAGAASWSRSRRRRRCSRRPGTRGPKRTSPGGSDDRPVDRRAARVPSGERRRTGAAPPASLAARHFSFWYGEKQALFDIDLDMPARSITALIGPSGCGKSTFLRSINRMHDLLPGAPHEGQILLDGRRRLPSPTLDPTALRRRVGMVFQRWNCFPKSIYDNVAYGPRINALASRRSSIGSSSPRSGAPRCGTRSRTGSARPPSVSPAASSNASASPGRSPTTPRCCSSTSRPARSTRSRRRRSKSCCTS